MTQYERDTLTPEAQEWQREQSERLARQRRDDVYAGQEAHDYSPLS